jgi:hypothetical protein
MSLLPFLAKKNRQQQESGVSSTIMRTPDSEDGESDEGDKGPMHAAAEDILRAISANDAQHLAMALQAAYDICNSTPSEEPSLEEEDEQ